MSNLRPERQLYKLLKSNIPEAHWQRLESWGVVPGIPDANACLNGVEAWIELKIVRGRKVMLTPPQVGWLRLRRAHGGRTFILARKMKPDMLYLWDGGAADHVADQGIACSEGLLCIMPVPFNWDGIARALFRVDEK